MPAALKNRSFRLLFTASAVSSFGDRVAPVALSFGVWRLTKSTVDVGIVLAAQAVPLVVFLLAGGVLADRIPRQVVMWLSDLVRAVTQGLTAVLLLTGQPAIWTLVALQGTYGIADAFFTPAMTGLVSQTVEADQMQQAGALVGLSGSVSAILGPSLAGVLVVLIGAGWGLAIDALSFVLSAMFLSQLRVPNLPALERSNVLEDLRLGWRTYRSHAWLWAIASFFAIYLAFGWSPLQVLGPKISDLFLGGAGAWGAIMAARGVGSLAGGYLALRWRPKYPLRAAFLIFIFGAPGMIAAFAAHAPVVLIGCFALVDGITASVINTMWFTVVQRRVPPEQLSRIAALDAVAGSALQPVGLAASGFIGATLGDSRTLFGACGLTLVLLAGILATPSVRNLTWQADSAAQAE